MRVKLRLSIPYFKQINNGEVEGSVILCEPNTHQPSPASASKSYHVYVIEVVSNCSPISHDGQMNVSHSRVHRVEKRYSQFFTLHSEVISRIWVIQELFCGKFLNRFND